MTGLGLRLARASVTRSLLIATCSAVVAGLLLVAVTWALLPQHVEEPLFEVIRDPGTRYGAVFAAVLGTVPLLYLHVQAARLGTALRERRFASMRMVGATLADARRLVAVEVGAPALLGSVLGIGLFAVLRSWLGSDVVTSSQQWVSPEQLGIGLIPADGPPWWSVVAVVLVVTVLAALLGVTASGVAATAGHTPASHVPARAPRPIGLLLLAAAGSLFAVTGLLNWPRQLGFVVVALAVLGILSLPGWIAYRVGKVAERRAASAPALVAARRIVTDPRPVGRAAAVIGAVALVSGGAGAFLADVVFPAEGYSHMTAGNYYTLSLLLVWVLLAIALFVALLTQVLRTVEATLDAKRSYSSLVAMGLPVGSLSRSQVLEALFVALPTCVVGVLLGSVPYGIVIQPTVGAAWLMVGIDVAVVLVVVLGTVLAVLATSPWMRRVTAWQQLRTE